DPYRTLDGQLLLAVVLGVPLEACVLAAMIDKAMFISYAFTVGGCYVLYLWHKSLAEFKKQNNSESG
ncbi:MAG: hypothetical protein GY694_08855, partial [Gammaproteobacteria bacterium]|nr:hypothetical protein [Gammaproteobacteria bacterium]